MRKCVALCVLIFAALVAGVPEVHGQGVTTASLTGVVRGPNGEPLAGAAVTATHTPSGTTYQGFTRTDGRYFIAGMRVGGPYRVTVQRLGYEAEPRTDVTLNLGVTTPVDFNARERAIALEAITVTTEEATVLSPNRTGAATAVGREELRVLPTLERRIEDFARLTPQYGGGAFGFSFAGQDNRLNNMTVDGSYFNNSFGLTGQPGGRTGVAPISIDAVEQVQIAIAPYDVRQSNFVGASINTVTRSGTNDYRGSLYYQFRNEGFVGKKAGANDFDPGTFDFRNIGGWVGGPIIRDRLFFFVNFEDESTEEPGTTWKATRGAGETGNVTRVRASSLDSLSNFLRTNFNYETGPYENYSFNTPVTRALAKVDFNLNTRNKFSLRYTILDSSDDILLSNSASLGVVGNRRSNSTGLNFANSNYAQGEKINSIVGEWNATFGTNLANNLIVGYTYQNEDRVSKGEFFPMVDILEAGTVYTTFGFEPFTPNNKLNYKSTQIQNNLTMYRANHTLTLGGSLELYRSENVFFPGSQSVYVYNSLADFYADANDQLRNPTRTTSPVTLRRFQVRYSNIPGQTEPVQPLEVTYGGLYLQDEWQVNDKLRVTLGLRGDVPKFGQTAYTNTAADQLSFRDEDGNSVKFQTGKLPDATPLWSPRLGFNWDVRGNRDTQIRGGTGIFTGRPAYVWISNQIGNTGVLTGFEQIDNTRSRPFKPDPNAYKPTNVTGAPAANYELALTDPDFKFPQVWRSNFAIDQRLPWQLIGTLEGIYTKDINGIRYINANLPAPQATVTEGPMTRPRWTSNRIHSNIANATVIKNQGEGYSWNLAASLEKTFTGGLFAKAAYSYGVSKNEVDPGSIAGGSFTGIAHPGDPNNPPIAYSNNSPGYRAFLALGVDRDFFSFGNTKLSIFAEKRTPGNGNYTYTGDLNGDGTSGNDLIYIPANTSEMNFQTYTQAAVSVGGVVRTPARTFTAQEQAEAWERFIQQDEYLSKHRGEYAERNGVFLPGVFRIDASAEQELFTSIAGRRNALSVRVDVLNFTNLLNSDWGINRFMRTTQPLLFQSVDASGRALYRLRNTNPSGTQHELISESFGRTSGGADVYRFLVSLRYSFN